MRQPVKKSGYGANQGKTPCSTQCRNAKPQAKPYKLTDSKGLYLEVKPNGVKAWRYRFKLAGKESVFAVGEYPAIPLDRLHRLYVKPPKPAKDATPPVEPPAPRTETRAAAMARTLKETGGGNDV